MSFVDAYHDRRKDEIKFVERVNGQRVYNSVPAEYTFYYEHSAGSHRSIFGDACKKFTTNDGRKFKREVGRMQASGKRTFESDINPVFRALEKHYRGLDAPVLNYGFFDIEAGFHEELGFAPTDDPFNEITAITVYLSHTKRLITLALCPSTLPLDRATAICDKFEDTFVFDDEAAMLRTFLEVIDDVDVLTGWNSEGYDIPYIVNRIIRILGEDYIRHLCLWNEKPREREYEKFGKMFKTYELVGRVHLDYLLLYQKHNPQQLHSYRLDFVGEIEIGENKTVYEGTLDDLYKKDFERFIEYNRQDVMLMVKLDEKKKFLELANQIAHTNCVLLKTTMGSVSLVEQAIIIEMHDMGFVAPERKPRPEEPVKTKAAGDDDEEEEEEGTPVVGAYVAKPKQGLHNEVGAIDINSLYPHILMSLNISPETIIGQIRPTETMALVEQRIADGTSRADAWDGIFNLLELDHVMARDGAPITVDFEDGRTKEMSGRDLYDYIFNPKNNVCVTANGTIIRTDQDGIIPTLLAKWYAQRKEMQKNQKTFDAMTGGIELPPDVADLLKLSL